MTLAWAVVTFDDEPVVPALRTRDEAIRHICWLLGEVVADPGSQGEPWRHLPSAEVSKAWRRLKRQCNLRAVRVTIEVHPNWRKEATP